MSDTTPKFAKVSRRAALLGIGASLLAFASAAQAQGLNPIQLNATPLGGAADTGRFNGGYSNGSLASAPTRSESQVYDRSKNPEAWDRSGVPVPAEVGFKGPHRPGELVIDYKNQYLYVVLPNDRALQVVIGVGRIGAQMIDQNLEVIFKEVDPVLLDRNGDPVNMPRGAANALGVRGMYLGPNYKGHVIHGTREPRLLAQPDGKRHVSAGCIRMHNDDVIQVYRMVKVGTKVTVYRNNETARFVVGGRQTEAKRTFSPG